ncbi:MAG: hypothetical protein A3H96_11550 [Acidobacteria bacterium RIFCSPLOWO2_02_FULL_67_36]|nr:MAG: hypothetical protein A3H96_11550 [Acidobacteria bacterium RIFCSPLOWO2_02_FULL_67_36]
MRERVLGEREQPLDVELLEGRLPLLHLRQRDVLAQLVAVRAVSRLVDRPAIEERLLDARELGLELADRMPGPRERGAGALPRLPPGVQDGRPQDCPVLRPRPQGV